MSKRITITFNSVSFTIEESYAQELINDFEAESLEEAVESLLNNDGVCTTIELLAEESLSADDETELTHSTIRVRQSS